MEHPDDRTVELIAAVDDGKISCQVHGLAGKLMVRNPGSII